MRSRPPPRGFLAAAPIPSTWPARRHTWGFDSCDRTLIAAGSPGLGPSCSRPRAQLDNAGRVTKQGRQNLGAAYARISAWLQEHSEEPAGPAWEVYYFVDVERFEGHASLPDRATWRHRIVQPIK